MSAKSKPQCPYSQYTLHDEKVAVGHGGETHQITQSSHETLTTQQGMPVSDDQNTLKAGPRGPLLMEDMHFREKMFHFDHERIPERVVHARGFGAHGYFESYESLSSLTAADIFQRKNEKTPAFVRFSTVAGNKGSPDLARDVRGFAVKLYTKQGNWDIVGNNIPVFFIQDPMKFPDLVHAAKQAPDRGFPQAQTAHDNFWDFVSLMPESMHMIMWIMSDRTLPRGFRFMEGFGVHTFRMVNAEGKSTFVKFHWKPKLGVQSVVWNEAVKINGADPDFHRRDLWTAIEQGDFPEWELGLQILDDEFIAKFPFDILDPTKLIPEEDAPIKIVGRLVLDKCVDNFFAETEQVAFCTQNIVPGIDFSNDPLLQGRNFSYLDTQIKRLGGPNFTHLPINAPQCPMRMFQQDGHMAMKNPKGRVNYEPNSWGAQAGPRENLQAGFKSFPEPIAAEKTRARSETFADHYSQARQFYISQMPIEQTHMADALVFELSKVERLQIRERVVSHLVNIDQDLASVVANGLGLIKMPNAAPTTVKINDKLKPSKALSIVKNNPSSFQGRKLGILIGEGFDEEILSEIKKELIKNAATFEIIAPKIGGCAGNKTQWQEAQQKIEGGPSVLYDAVVVLVSTAQVPILLKEPAVRDFIADAFAHNKFIGYTETALPLFKKAGVTDLDRGCVLLNKTTVSKFFEECKNKRFWEREG